MDYFRVRHDTPGANALNSKEAIAPLDSAAANRALPPDDGSGTHQDLSGERTTRHTEIYKLAERGCTAPASATTRANGSLPVSKGLGECPMGKIKEGLRL